MKYHNQTYGHICKISNVEDTILKLPFNTIPRIWKELRNMQLLAKKIIKKLK